MSDGLTVALVQTVAPDYRERVFRALGSQLGDGFRLYAGTEYFEPSVRSSVESASPMKNWFLFGRRVLVQTGAWSDVMSADVAIFEMNPRILSNWLFLLMRRASGKKSILWGHAWPRSGQAARSDVVRRAMRRLAHGIVVYTERQAKELQEVMPGKTVIAAPNSLYYAHEMAPATSGRDPHDFIYVGRMTAAKKPDLLVRGFSEVADALAPESRLLMVGDGPLLKELRDLASRQGLGERIVFTGHVSDPDRLRALYGESVASVSPGYVGLSITQSFAHGVPMLVARDETHSPEIEAAIEEFNAYMFESDSVAGLRQALLRAWNMRSELRERSPAIVADCLARYTVEIMSSRIVTCVETVTGTARA